LLSRQANPGVSDADKAYGKSRHNLAQWLGHFLKAVSKP
jgi:hypothetical protein